jgi:hypothetical protein
MVGTEPAENTGEDFESVLAAGTFPGVWKTNRTAG